MIVKHFSGTNVLFKIKTEWQEILQNHPDVRFYHYYEWVDAIIDLTKTENKIIHAFVVYRLSKPIAIFILKENRRCVGNIPVTCLEFPRHSHVPFSDIIMNQNTETSEVLFDLVSFLRSSRRLAWDVLYLTPLEDDSNVCFSLYYKRPSMSLKYEIGHSDFIECKNFKPIETRVSKNFRRNLRKNANKISKLENVYFVNIRNPEELGEGFANFMEVEAAGWKGGNGKKSAIKFKPEIRKFYCDLIESLSSKGCCEINFLMVGDKPIAGQFCILSGRTINCLKIGYDECFRHLSPGNLLLDWAIKKCSLENGIDNFSLVSGSDWHNDWKPCRKPVQEVSIFNKSMAGLLTYFLKRSRQYGANITNRMQKALQCGQGICNI